MNLKISINKKIMGTVLSTIMLMVFIPTIASANYYDGGGANVSNPTSAQALIYTPLTYPTINTSPSSNQFSSSWVMVYEESTSTPGDLFQVGPAKGSSHTYKTYISGSNWVGMVDSTVIGTLPISGVTPDSVQYSAEVSNDTIYGSVNNFV